LTAERLCLLAARLTGADYPAAELERAWKNVLFNQFHDILAGCCIESAYADAFYLHGECMSITERAINRAMQAISAQVETARGHAPGELCHKHFLTWEHKELGTPVLVFNPHAFPVRTLLRRRADCKSMTDEQGRTIPCQQVRGEATNGEHDLYETAFIAELPAFGYRLYRYFPTKEQQSSNSCVKAELHTLENTRIRAEFDPESGELCRIYDKKNERVICHAPCGTVLLDEHECDTWAHNRFDLGPACGQFANPQFEILEAGEVCAVLRVTQSCGESVLERTYTLINGSDQLSVELRVTVRQMHRTLKLTFPASDKVTCEIPFGSIERPLCNGEEPFGTWLASGNLGIANDGKYGYDSTAESLRMTILRTAVYADHYGVRDGRYHHIDTDTHKAHYLIFPYTDAADAHRRAALFNCPVRSVNASFHHGTLPEAFCGIENVPDALMISAIKKSVDNDQTVLRCWNAGKKDIDANLSLLGKPLRASLCPHAIRTYDENGTPLDFMEWQIQ
jgi:alpha-mannosidase